MGQRGSALLDALLAATLVALVVGGIITAALASVRAAHRQLDMQAAVLAVQEKVAEIQGLPAAEVRRLAALPQPLTAPWPPGTGFGATSGVVYAVYVTESVPGLFQVGLALRRSADAAPFYQTTTYVRPWR